METNVPSLKKIVLDLLKFQNTFDENEFKTNVLDDVYDKVENIVKTDIDEFAKKYIEEKYLNRFDLKDDFKDSIIDKIFDSWDLDGDLYTMYDHYYDQDDEMYDIKGVTNAYCELIEERLKHLYVGVMSNAQELENEYGHNTDDDDEDNEFNIHLEIIQNVHTNMYKRSHTHPRKMYRFEYLLLLWQLQDTNSAEVNKRKRKDEYLEILLGKI
tara:strand:+ start:4036 stop:4674 length:639 start_codon:yes stop_codon:yes gene_type:complete